MKKLSITDIAAHFNISKTTVSFILNNRAKEMRISDQLVLKVQHFAKEVGYRPNPIAKSLRTGKTNIIGLMVENIADPFFAAIARRIENKAYQNGYKIIYCSTDNDTEKTKELLTMFRERSVDGYIIAPPEGIEEEIHSLVNAGTPVVFFDRFLPKIKTDYVEVDNKSSTQHATKHLLDQGFKNIAFITFTSMQTQMAARLEGYQQTITNAGLKTYVKQVAFNQDEALIIQPIVEFLQNNKEVDAVIFGAIQAGSSGLKALNKLGYEIPKDMAVISFDDCDVFELFSPSITAILQPIEEIAEQSIDLLLNRLNNPTKDINWQKITIKTAFIQRNSSQKFIASPVPQTESIQQH